MWKMAVAAVDKAAETELVEVELVVAEAVEQQYYMKFY